LHIVSSDNQHSTLEQIAAHYAEELNAQFRTLNVFTTKAPGDIGRVHEAYLRGVIKRFMPGKISLGSGFVVSGDRTSPQQDILIYNAHDFPPLFQVGDCVVVHRPHALYSVEVKTNLASRKELAETIQRRMDLNAVFGIRGGIYAWEGADLQTTLDVIWDEVRNRSSDRSLYVPDVIYVRSKYLLVYRWEGAASSPKPYFLLKIGPDDEGKALLDFVRVIWRRLAQEIASGIGSQMVLNSSPLGPSYGFTTPPYSLVDLPPDLQQRFRIGG